MKKLVTGVALVTAALVWCTSAQAGWGIGIGWPGYYRPYPYRVYVAPPPLYVTPAYVARAPVYVQAAAIPAREVPAYLDVLTPADAEVFIGGQKTVQTGPRRLFYSPPLTPDRAFAYEIQAKWLENGREVTLSRTVRVHAGERVMVDLTRSMPKDRPRQ
jgi:uncharacterized protein (TIGR03000 family)